MFKICLKFCLRFQTIYINLGSARRDLQNDVKIQEK